MKAILNQIRVSPRKAQLVAALIRNKKVTEAQDILKFTPKKAAKVLLKALNSAAGNAENNFNQKVEDLVVSKVHVGKGIVYKRFRPISRGRAHPILKKTSNITVEVSMQTPEKEVKPEKKEVKAEEKPKVEKKAKSSKASAKEEKEANTK
jgi:large subunit ribosomal protein L22